MPHFLKSKFHSCFTIPTFQFLKSYITPNLKKKRIGTKLTIPALISKYLVGIKTQRHGNPVNI